MDGTARPDELNDRLEMLKEADRIIGKPIVDVEVDEKLAEFNSLKLALLEPKLDNATAKRVAFLERFRDTIEEQIAEDPDRQSLNLEIEGWDLPRYDIIFSKLSSDYRLLFPIQVAHR